MKYKLGQKALIPYDVFDKNHKYVATLECVGLIDGVTIGENEEKQYRVKYSATTGESGWDWVKESDVKIISEN